jgi:hypothetical protein
VRWAAAAQAAVARQEKLLGLQSPTSCCLALIRGAQVRERFEGARLEATGRLRLGLGINNSKLCGCVFPEIVNYDEYLAAFAQRWPQARARALRGAGCWLRGRRVASRVAERGESSPRRWSLSSLPQNRAPQIEGWFDLEGIRAAFDAVDFVGISAYVPQERVDFQPCNMERLMEKARSLGAGSDSGAEGLGGPNEAHPCMPWRIA